MEMLIKSFGNGRWKINQELIDGGGEFRMCMERNGGGARIEYVDWGTGPGGSSVGIELWQGDNLVFILTQEVNKELEDQKEGMEYHIECAPFKDEHTHIDGIHYGLDGRMNPVRNVKGLPKRIDMELTVWDFLTQVIEGRFGTPHLIKYGF